MATSGTSLIAKTAAKVEAATQVTTISTEKENTSSPGHLKYIPLQNQLINSPDMRQSIASHARTHFQLDHKEENVDPPTKVQTVSSIEPCAEDLRLPTRDGSKHVIVKGIFLSYFMKIKFAIYS